MLVHRVAADLGDVRALRGVVHVGEARVVELQVGAAELAEPPHLLRVGRGQVGPERVEVRVHLGVDRSPAAAVVDHARRRDRQLRHRSVGAVLHEPKVVAEDRLRYAESPVDVHRGRREIDVAVGPVELNGQASLQLRHTVERVDEVHVPRRAPELAVGGRPQADLGLLANRLADRLVLDRAQRVTVDRAPRERGTGLEQLRRAQQAAHVVGAERRPHPRNLTDGLGTRPPPSRK